ncbi:MAG: hypothetical protein KKC76_18855 [Proteobacteria bacterium]|nr:hypothetical protein [Pseudomonadota bacterium]MBU4295269.1 hypothetical protein [Pseudomonadota bacterium]
MQQIQKANRLKEITQRIGFAIWQIQELEGVSAQYFVLLGQAKKGMGEAAGNDLVKKAKKNTFGRTIKDIRKKGLLNKDLGGRFLRLLSERNWLVHQSRTESRDAVHSDIAMQRLISRIDAMADESLALLKEIGSLSIAHMNKHGVNEESIYKRAEALLNQWHSSEEI